MVRNALLAGVVMLALCAVAGRLFGLWWGRRGGDAMDAGVIVGAAAGVLTFAVVGAAAALSWEDAPCWAYGERGCAGPRAGLRERKDGP